jgi:hypothetical protein
LTGGAWRRSVNKTLHFSSCSQRKRQTFRKEITSAATLGRGVIAAAGRFPVDLMQSAV